ncbi:unnamed protein product (macronuclear) [Paramecium tetraurelia]|uniref:Intimal thickness related receptor IRP domain-containing protein n=1 Tax=Paramecium tetraurelia TaxID=5888 RepID=A0D2R6_PARTE|nr:uncharacterized protein GSPATT00012841001 [Paramecium tetraurelia]CAK77333.1 unnamed protein product [Paramecium tetraurelia]|eukprot:XP_001444730.1 hypothetical protein (macronuclear) [Paramecium tetraurelia strain d4-2]
MKNLFIFGVLIGVFYFIDKQLNIKFIESEILKRNCQYSQQGDNENIEYCVFIWNSNETLATFYFLYSLPVDITQNIKIYYQQFQTSKQLTFSNVFLEDQKNSTFPFIDSESIKQEIQSSHNLNMLDFTLKLGNINNNEYYIMTTQLSAVCTYAIFTKSLNLEITAYFKNNLKYLEDGFVAFLCLVIMFLANQLNKLESATMIPLGNYIKQNKPHMLLIIILIAQPLRPLCYFPEFEAIEWLIGQTCYAIGEFLFLRYFLQILSYLQGQNNKTNKLRNTLVSIFVIIPISIDRWLISFENQSFVIKDLENQVDNINNLLKICWICYLLYASIFAYEIMISLQSHLIRLDLFIIDILFFMVYSFQKSSFYLYYENYDHHLFNPINMLMMTSYIALLLHTNFNKEIEQTQELTNVRHQIDQEDENGENIESTIAEYYMEKSSDDQTLI